MNGSASPSASTLRPALVAAVALLAALWLWFAWCRFPDDLWNDMRVATAAALARGIDIYPTATSGTINTWTYGPLPLVALLPATFASSPGGALLGAGAINLLLIVGTIVLSIAGSTASLPRAERLSLAALGTAAAVFLWPEPSLRCYYADTLAVACGLVSSTLLARAGESRTRLWLAALLGAATLACKQTSLGIPAAQVAWLWLARDRRAALAHLGRGLVCGTALGVAALLWFGWPGLSFILLELPSGFPRTPDPVVRLGMLAGPLAVQLGGPLLVLAVAPRQCLGRRAPLLFPTLLWACSLPLGLAALLRLGGGINSFHGFELWLPPVLAALLSSGAATRRAAIGTGIAVAALLVGGVRLLRAPPLPITPQIAFIEEGAALARAFPGRIWFPINPLISLYADGRYYCDEDGINTRVAAGRAPTMAQLLPQLPAQWSAIAVRYRRDPATSTAENLIPRDARRLEFGRWHLSVWRPLEPR